MRRLVQTSAVTLLWVSAAAAQPNVFDRDKWPTWDRRGECDVRVYVLKRDALEVKAAAEAPCRILWGRWIDPYTNQPIYNPALVDIDHVVALKWVFEHGGARWDAERRRAYANWTRHGYHLRAVHQSQNSAKGARGPFAWRPPDPAAHCWYGQVWATTIFTWRLEPGAADRRAIDELLATCGPGARE